MSKATGSKPARTKSTTTESTTTESTGLKRTGSASLGGTTRSSTKVGKKTADGRATTARPTIARSITTKPTIATPWGRATVVERLSVPQRAGDRRFASSVELLEGADGERLVRVAYSTGGVVRRGPVTLRLRDVARLREASLRVPELAEAFGWDVRLERAGDA